MTKFEKEFSLQIDEWCNQAPNEKETLNWLFGQLFLFKFMSSKEGVSRKEVKKFDEMFICCFMKITEILDLDYEKIMNVTRRVMMDDKNAAKPKGE